MRYTFGMHSTEKVALCRFQGVHEHSALARWFPPPSMLVPPSVGIDISDSSVKWISLSPAECGWHLAACGAQDLPGGTVSGGAVKNVGELSKSLKKVREKTGMCVAHAALPEELGYVFSMHVPDVSDRRQVLTAVEFELEGRVPITAEQSEYDFDVITRHSGSTEAEIGVTVFPREIVDQYEEAFKLAGMELASLELEARSIARSVLPVESREVVLLADFGRARTGIAIIKNRVPIFTSTVSVGGDMITKLVMENLSVDEKQAEEYKNEFGVSKTDEKKLFELMMGTAAALSDEIARHYRYWDTKKNEEGERVTSVARLVLAGGSANLKGLPAYIAARVQAPAERAQVWQNVCSFDDYIPPIDKHRGLGFATAIGLALRGV